MRQARSGGFAGCRHAAHDAQFVGLQLLRQPLRFAVVVGSAKVALGPGEEQQVGKDQQEEEQPNSHGFPVR
jgi:hypothetical protein